MKPTLKEFLQTGRLGSLVFGATEEDARQILGHPEDTSVNKKNRPLIWKYGSLQLHFDQGLLNFIGLYFSDHEFRLPAGLSLVGWMPTSTTSLNEFQKH